MKFSVLHPHNLTLLSTALAALSLSATMTCAAPPADVAIPVAYSAPADGLLSLTLSDEKGQLVRSLLSALPVKAGKSSVTWDGAEDLGRVCPPGDYSVKGLFFDTPPSLKYRMTVGRSGNPPYRTPDGKGDWGVSGRTQPARDGRMKTSHFEGGIAHEAALAAEVRGEPTQREPATFHRRPGVGRYPTPDTASGRKRSGLCFDPSPVTAPRGTRAGAAPRTAPPQRSSRGSRTGLRD